VHRRTNTAPDDELSRDAAVDDTPELVDDTPELAVSVLEGAGAIDEVAPSVRPGELEDCVQEVIAVVTMMATANNRPVPERTSLIRIEPSSRLCMDYGKELVRH